MLIYNTPMIENKKIEPIQIVTADIVIGINVFKDIFASFSDFFGGRSHSYEDALSKAKADAINKLISQTTTMRADAIINVHFEILSVGPRGGMICVSITGTAVKFC